MTCLNREKMSLRFLVILLVGWASAGCTRTDQPTDKPATSSAPGAEQAAPPVSPDPSKAGDLEAPARPPTSPPSTAPNTPITSSQKQAEVPPAISSESVPTFEPLADAAVGEWVRFQATGSRELRYEVVRVGAATVTTRVVVLENGKPLGLPSLREDMRNWDPLAASARSTKATRSATRAPIEAAGRSWDAWVYEDRWTEEGVSYVRRTWVHPDAPVLGTLRMELTGGSAVESSLELIAFGRPDQVAEAEKAR